MSKIINLIKSSNIYTVLLTSVILTSCFRSHLVGYPLALIAIGLLAHNIFDKYITVIKLHNNNSDAFESIDKTITELDKKVTDMSDKVSHLSNKDAVKEMMGYKR